MEEVKPPDVLVCPCVRVFIDRLLGETSDVGDNEVPVVVPSEGVAALSDNG